MPQKCNRAHLALLSSVLFGLLLFFIVIVVAIDGSNLVREVLTGLLLHILLLARAFLRCSLFLLLSGLLRGSALLLGLLLFLLVVLFLLFLLLNLLFPSDPVSTLDEAEVRHKCEP